MPNPSLQQVVSQRQARSSASQSRATQAPFPSTSAQNEFPNEQKKDDAPPDWLAPKIYKGSTNVE